MMPYFIAGLDSFFPSAIFATSGRQDGVFLIYIFSDFYLCHDLVYLVVQYAGAKGLRTFLCLSLEMPNNAVTSLYPVYQLCWLLAREISAIYCQHVSALFGIFLLTNV